MGAIFWLLGLLTLKRIKEVAYLTAASLNKSNAFVKRLRLLWLTLQGRLEAWLILSPSLQSVQG